MNVYNFISIVLSAVLSSACVFLLSIVARHFHLLSGVKKIPLVGGLAIGFVCGIFMVFWGHGIFLLTAFLMLASGFWDDIRELSVAGKICTQIISCGLLIWSGVRTHIVSLNEITNIIVTITWVLVVTNAFNLLDIMDGLCAGITIIVAAGLLAICMINGNMQTAVLLLVLIGAVSGFLIFNMPPAKAYLGNAGSHFLGFMLAAISISISYASADRQVALLSPVLVMGFPIFDTLFVVVMRLKKGRSAFRKSKDHLALRFIKLGHSQNKALLSMVALALIFAVSGVMVSKLSNWIGAIVVLMVLLYVFLLTIKMNKVLIDG